MGYTTEFEGQFIFDLPLLVDYANYIRAFNRCRKMKRKEAVVRDFPDMLREKVGLPVGRDGCFYVGGGGFKGQAIDKSVIDFNIAPNGVPDFWCKWTVSKDNCALVWDGGEKFYYYVEWLDFLIKNFFDKWGYTLNGEMFFQGEEIHDAGKIIVQNNIVTKKMITDL